MHGAYLMSSSLHTVGCHGQVSTGSGDSEVPGILWGLGCAGRVLGLLHGAAQTEVLLLQRGRLGSRPGHQTPKQRPATDLWGDPRLVPSPLGLSFPAQLQTETSVRLGQAQGHAQD